jgi:hypothetical protein
MISGSGGMTLANTEIVLLIYLSKVPRAFQYAGTAHGVASHLHSTSMSSADNLLHSITCHGRPRVTNPNVMMNRE